MAKPLSPADRAEGATGKANMANRSASIGKDLEKLYQLDCQIEAALAKHVTHLREEKGKIKAGLRADFELTTNVINARYGSFKLERKARDNGDEATLAAMREMYEIQPIGGQLDFITATEAADAKGNGKGAEA